MQAYFVTILAICEVLTPILTEALKKMLDELHKGYNSTVLALISALVLTSICGGWTIAHFNLGFSIENIINLVILWGANWLGATVGYDKIKELLTNGIEY